MPLKKTQGFAQATEDRPRTVDKYGCVVLEVQDWIDAINNPSWQRDPKIVAGPKDTQPWILEAQYAFNTRPVLPGTRGTSS
jgi:aldose 1-epimerase